MQELKITSSTSATILNKSNDVICGEVSAKGIGEHVVERSRNGVSISPEIGGLPLNISFDWSKDYAWQEEIVRAKEPMKKDSCFNSKSSKTPQNSDRATNDGNGVFPIDVSASNETEDLGLQWALLQFESPVCTPLNALFIASRLDTDCNSSTCRLAFYGRITTKLELSGNITRQGHRGISSSYWEYLKKLRLFKLKRRVGTIARLGNAAYTQAIDASRSEAEVNTQESGMQTEQRYHDILGKDLFKKETDMKQFIGRKVVTEKGGYVGEIESAFGQSGKFRVVFRENEYDKRHGVPVRLGEKFFLQFKRYIFSDSKELHQDKDSLNISVRSPVSKEPNVIVLKKSANNKKSADFNETIESAELVSVKTRAANTSSGSKFASDSTQRSSERALRSSATPFEPPSLVPLMPRQQIQPKCYIGRRRGHITKLKGVKSLDNGIDRALVIVDG